MESIESQLEKVLQGLSEVATHRCVWDDIDLDSDWYNSEIEICKVLCYSGHLFSELDEQREVRRLIEEGDRLSKEQKMMVTPSAESLIVRVTNAKEQWASTIRLLSVLTYEEEVQGDLSTRCLDRISTNLWHLQIYGNGLHMEPGLRRQTISHLKYMARHHRIDTTRPDFRRGDKIKSNSPKSKGTPTTKVRKTRAGQGLFAKNLQKAYNCTRYLGAYMEIWCPVTKDWIPKGEPVAAHIVPFSLGDDLAEDLFGNGTKLMDLRNGLYLHKDVEHAFDNAQMVILPIHNQNPLLIDRLFQVRVLDESLLTQTYGNGNYKWSDVHRQNLDFRDTHQRPARRYLYFHMLFAMIRLSIQQQRLSWARSLPELTSFPVWITKEEYLQKGILLNIVSVIGNADMENRIVEYIPSESPEPGCTSYVEFPESCAERSHESSEAILGWMEEYASLGCSDSE